MDAKILPLLEQIIEKAEQDDRNWKSEMINSGKAQKAVGKSWMVFHLEILKELIENDNT
tara:strand:- start:123 stop:299 length:177 start_codon:yes stop_codon:yes gene_type:complete